MAQENTTTEADSATKQKLLFRCFESAREQFTAKHQSTASRESGSKRAEFDRFLQGTNFDDLEQMCKDLGDQAEDKANNASRLWNTLDMLKTTGDAFIECAPESVSMVWFGISSLIQIGSAKLQTRLLICGTCDSIANIIMDCIRWEARMGTPDAGDTAPKLDIWDSDVPDLIFSILDFLWSAKPHFDQSRLKRLGSTLKDVFTKDIQQKVDSLLEKYQEIVRIAQMHFEDSLLNENLQTGTKLKQITDNISKFASIGSELVDAVNRQTLLDELDRKQDKIKISETHKTHIKTLNDNLTRIMQRRNGRFVAGWIFQEDAYIDWKSQSNNTNALYIRGPRGHGKSVAMMSISRALSAENPVICHFFFKKGEQDIQQSRTGLESLLYQLLDSDQLRNDMAALANTIDILNPGFGDPQKAHVSPDAFLANLTSLSDAIRMVAGTVKQRVYLIIDALDECQDRREQNFGQHLISMVNKKSDGLRIIFSARDSIDVISELSERPDELKVIHITPEKNSRDLEEYLQDDVGAVLKRRINQDRFSNFFNKELTRIVSIIHHKAKGDFTIARLIIASLQQPSKESLETKIQKLPAAIGDIYMASLESLTPDEQELIVVFLKWVVWSVSGMTVIEISDHYRELYKDRSTTRTLPQNDDSGDSGDLEKELPRDLEYDADMKDLISNDPYEDPDVKDIIHHIENAGRDFFKLDRTTGVVSVDISIREWIQEDISSKSKIVESRGFHKSRDQKGNTVFKFTLTPSFIRYGDSLNELFVKREAQMSVALDILRALNNGSFQDKYMPWEPQWLTSDSDSEALSPHRYEIRSWQDHIQALQAWWSDSSLDDSWWSELLTQVSIFIRPENIQRWNVQAHGSSHYVFHDMYDSNKIRYLRRSFQKPIHVACMFGLRLMVDYIMQTQLKGTSKSVGKPQSMDSHQDALYKRITAILDVDSWQPDYLRLQILIENMEAEDLVAFLKGATGIDIESHKQEDLANGLSNWILSNLDPETILTWLALSESSSTSPVWFYTFLESDRLSSVEFDEAQGLTDWIHRCLDLEKEVQVIIDQYGNDETLLLARFKELITNHLLTARYKSQIFDTPDPYGRLPLFLAAKHPDTVKALIGYGADPNKLGQTSVEPQRVMYVSRFEKPLLSILQDIVDINRRNNLGDGLEDKPLQPMLQSAAILVPKTTHLEEIKGLEGKTLLHMAAEIGNLEFFKMLCLLGRWDIHAKCNRENTPLHYLFEGRPRPDDINKVNDVLEICRIMVNMKRSDGEDLVNAQNSRSENPLALAVKGYWIEGIELLIELGVDVHDDDIWDRGCFHNLVDSSRQNEKVEMKIATILFDAGVDPTKRGKDGIPPLWSALRRGKFYLVRFFLEKYVELGKISRGNLGFLKTGSFNIFHWILRAGYKGTSIATDLKSGGWIGNFVRTVIEYGVDVSDIRHLLLQGDSKGRIPAELSIWAKDLPAVQEIFTICPDLGSWGPPNREPLLSVAGQAAGSIVPRIEGAIDPDITVLRSKELVNYLLERSPPISLVMFETQLFDPNLTGWKGLNLQSISDLYGLPFRDSSGWSLVDILTHLKREKFIEILQLIGQGISSPGMFAKPLRISKIENPFGELSADGLEYYITDESRLEIVQEDTFLQWELQFPQDGPTVFADHPVPPTGKPFYFEVRVSRPLGDLAQSLLKSKNKQDAQREPPIPYQFEIGFAFPALRTATTLIINHEGTVIGYDSFCDNSPEESNPQDLDPPAGTTILYIGCGLDPPQNKIFYTFNGQLLRSVTTVPTPARCLPTFVCTWAFEKFKFNFGAERFQFEPANNPDWSWDECLLALKSSKTSIAVSTPEKISGGGGSGAE